MNTQKLRVGIIGCGSIHHQHVNALLADDRVALVAFADTNTAKAEKSAAAYGGKAYSDYIEMTDTEKLDALHICTPHYLHEPMAVAAMERGCHVFCEKPMAITVDGAEKMMNTSRKTGKKLGICFQNRFRETSQLVMRLIRSGEVGKVLGAKALLTWNRGIDYYRSGEWRGKWATEGGGVLINQSIHTLDLLDQFCGGFSSVNARVSRCMLPDPYVVEDTAMANFMLKSGGNAVFFATTCYATCNTPEIALVCEKAVLTLGNELIIEYLTGRKDLFSDPKIITNGKAVWGSCHRATIAHFYDALFSHGKEEFLIGPEEGIRTVKLINGIYTSDKTGEYV
ncbi:MAG: Gfo/Idh/MocA family oxidoreductase, partial [Oscillospiraceae bacterium]|nr:Gfo/Idh/MocA family oxidoreductase [Oscillospiraceae bacterium]